MSFIINPYAVYTAPTYTYNARSVDTSNATAYTFTNFDIGAADSSRFVIVGIQNQEVGSQDISSVTIGGNAATQILKTGVGSRNTIAFYGLTVSSGTTATIVVTFASGAQNCAIASFSLYNLESTAPSTTVTSTANPLVLDANTVTDAIVIGMAGQNSVSTVTFSWSGLTEIWDEQVEAALGSWGGAAISNVSAETPRSISVSFSASPSSQQRGAVLVMR